MYQSPKYFGIALSMHHSYGIYIMCMYFYVCNYIYLYKNLVASSPYLCYISSKFDVLFCLYHVVPISRIHAHASCLMIKYRTWCLT